ncbi:MAG: hypothetical protein Nkreftii_002760 [Candidatus Nitrospira kreftii]|uniref:Uncharacterized protein n=1 Tax=Candidatus Nitrospira kreftii TaxID=2652173 RepID=A0A7S8FFW4_9BACT|nr:MAG: hypothetical protein Nkreftii_002760 [Candidatus Nitrospira kreftii]
MRVMRLIHRMHKTRRDPKFPLLKRYAPSDKLEIIEDDLAMKLYITWRGEKRSLYLLEN